MKSAMSRKSGDVATVRCKLKLMVTRVQVYFREHCGAVKVMDKVINREGCDVHGGLHD